MGSFGVGESKLGIILDASGAPVAASARLSRTAEAIVLDVLWPPTGQLKEPETSEAGFVRLQTTDGVWTIGRMEPPLTLRSSPAGAFYQETRHAEVAVQGSGSFSKIRGMSHEIAGLEHWLFQGLEPLAIIGAEGSGWDIEKFERIELGKVELALKCYVDRVHAHGGIIEKKLRVLVQTTSSEPLDWKEHEKVHDRFCDLVALATGQAITRRRDIAVSSDGSAANWRPAMFAGEDSASLEFEAFPIHYHSLGHEGLCKWFALADRLPRLVGQVLSYVRKSDLLTVEECILVVATAYEHLVADNAVAFGLRRPKADEGHFVGKVELVLNSLPRAAALDVSAWAVEFNRAYKTAKHNPKSVSTKSEMASYAAAGFEFLRAWISQQIGLPVELDQSVRNGVPYSRVRFGA